MPKRAREPEESEPELWAVEKIIGAQRTDESLCKESTDPLSPSFGQGWEYLVKWDRYDISDSTWEPFTHLRNCQELLRNFWEDAGEEAMVTNIPNFEILVRPEWSEPVSSRAKKKKRQGQKSLSRHCTTALSRKESIAADSENRVLKIKIRPPIVSTSTIQTPTNFTTYETTETPPIPPSVPTRATPVTPITPPLTPEPEPAAYLDETAIPPLELTPTFVPNEHAAPSNVPDVYLGHWQPVDEGFGLQPRALSTAPEENGPFGSSLLFAVGPDPDLGDLIFNTPSDTF